MELTAVLTPAKKGGYVALNPDAGTTTQSETREEAIANPREAPSLYLSVLPPGWGVHVVMTSFAFLANG